jgi:hypothetical protein
MPDKQREKAKLKRKATALLRAPQRQEDQKFIYGDAVKLLKPSMDQQEVLARFSEAILQSPGNSMTAQFLVDRMKAAKIKIGLSTNEYHRGIMRVDPDHYMRESNRGRPTLVDDDQVMLLTGWVVHQSRIGEEVHYPDIVAFLDQHFALKVSEDTVARICHKNGLGVKIAKVTGTAQAASALSRQSETIAFIGDLDSKGFFQTPQSNIYSVDGTFTSHKSHTRRTIAPKSSYVCALCLLLCLPTL